METNSGKKSILIVDDTPANLEILIRVFQKENYKVRAVTSGMMAIRSAVNDPPELILLDVTMPEMNGYDVCRRLKEIENLKNIPVIFISALTETFDKIAAFESGGVDYITKPIQLEEALARVKTHLTLRKYQQLLETRNNELNLALDQLKEAQGQLINSEKMASLGVLTAGIAHEINNPISFIYTSSLGLSKNIQFFLEVQNMYDQAIGQCDEKLFLEIEEYKRDHDFAERFQELSLLTENIVTGSKRISGIVNSLRHFARLDESDMKSIDIHENIDSTLLLLHHRISNRIMIEKDYGAIPLLPCYPARISQVLMNIISNAIDTIEEKDETEEPEYIRIKTGLFSGQGNEYLMIEVKDSGKGIPEGIQKKIFDPFFTTKPVGKGMGLGLSISNNIIREHGGRIDVKNLESQGTSFTILLPIFNSTKKS